MIIFLGLLVTFFFLLAVFLLIYSCHQGNESFMIYGEKRTKLQPLFENSDGQLLICEVEFANEGKQPVNMMDIFTRSKLNICGEPSKFIWSKAELSGRPRKDDYFEAMVINAKQKGKLLLHFVIPDTVKWNHYRSFADSVDITIFCNGSARRGLFIRSYKISILPKELEEAMAKNGQCYK